VGALPDGPEPGTPRLPMTSGERPEAKVLIVGGGPAGLATALFLADADPALAPHIVVLEKERYPREKICAGAVGGRADRALASIGIRLDVPSVPIRGMSVRTAEGAVTRVLGDIGRVVRRAELDAALAVETRKRGIRILEDTRVTSLRVLREGVTVETSRGPFRAEVLVGADGVGSVVRRSLGLPFGSLHAQVLEVDTERVAGDGPEDVLAFDLSEQGYVGYAWDFATPLGGRVMVSRGVYQLRLGEGPHADVRELLGARLARIGLRLEDHRQKRFGERGFEHHRAYSAPRVLLVGEAAGIDPLTGEGIAQAIDYGRAAGPYLAEKIARGDLRLHDWPRRFYRSRIGVDLLVRSLALRLEFGPLRRFTEAWLVGSAPLMDLTLAAFGGLPVSRADLARVALSLAEHGAEWALRGVSALSRARSGSPPPD
jgi:flavin-dependent dehydrogenase